MVTSALGEFKKTLQARKF